jgi:hypothetical protein
MVLMTVSTLYAASVSASIRPQDATKMTKSDYCRARAEGCKRKADAAGDPKVKAQLIDFADQWRYMAEQAEQSGSIGGLIVS